MCNKVEGRQSRNFRCRTQTCTLYLYLLLYKTEFKGNSMNAKF